MLTVTGGYARTLFLANAFYEQLYWRYGDIVHGLTGHYEFTDPSGRRARAELRRVYATFDGDDCRR